MRQTWSRVLLLILIGSGVASAQGVWQSFPPPVPSEVVPIPTEVPEQPPLVPTAATTPAYYPVPTFSTAPVVYPNQPARFAAASAEPVIGALHNRWLFEAEYLLWWVRNGDAPVGGFIGAAPVSDLVNSSNGSLPNLTPLGGHAQSFDFGAQSGLRLTLTGYFDDEQGWGFDLNWFQFLKQTVSELAASNGDVLLGPTYTNLDGTRALILAAFPSSVTINGTTLTEGRAAVVTAQSSDRLWGAEINARFRLPVIFFDRLFLIAGFRTVQWGEGISIDTTSVPLPGSSAVSTIGLHDSFTALNQFYGGQIGLQTRLQCGRFSLELTDKIALGGEHEQIKIDGATVIALPGSVTRLSGGVLAQATNMGTTDAGRLTWLNEVTVKGGFNLSDNLRATIGYNFLYLGDVVRVTPAVDAVDPRSIQVLSSFDPNAHVTRPIPPTLQESRWWAQGLTFGLELSF
jgi:hypothetical protein